MDDLSAALGGILKDPGALEQLTSLARQMGLSPPEGRETPSVPALPPALLEAAAGLFSSGEDTPSERFLTALAPLLSPASGDRLDRARRALRLTRAARMAMAALPLEKL